MKLKRKLGLTCALALGTIASVATIGFTTVSCSSGDSLDYTSPNYKPSAAIASEFTSRDFNQIEQNIPWLEKQVKAELGQGITNVEMKVSLDDTHFIQTTNVTGVMPQYSRMSAPNVPVTITYTLDINLAPNPSGQYEVKKSTSIVGQSVSEPKTVQWSRQQVQETLQPLWQGPNDSSNQAPDNTPNANYKPSSAIAKKFSLADFNRINANSIKFADYMKSTLESNPNLPPDVTISSVTCTPRLNGDHFILSLNIVQTVAHFGTSEQETIYDYCLTPNSNGT